MKHQDIGITLLELAISATPAIAGFIMDVARGKEPTTEEGRRVRSILAPVSASREALEALEKEAAVEAIEEAKASQ